MTEDARSEFERIFGSTQRTGETRSPDDTVRAGTQRLPSDSDVLGIRTDSDRFLLKNVPERLPIDPKTDAAPAVKSDTSPEPNADPSKSSPDAMTIALNVNVFANLADTKAGDGKGVASDGPTFVIPLPKPGKTASDSGKGPIATAKDEKAASQTDTEFTRILHVQDTITVPKPNPPTKPSVSTPAVAAEPKTQVPAPQQPAVIPASGPSDFTKVVKGSELRAIQERLAASNAAGMQPQQPWQPGSAPPVPQYVPAHNANWPHPTPHANAPAHPQSKLSQYMPLIIALNVLFVLAILLIVFFAVKK